MALERRFVTESELRVRASGKGDKIGGYAAKFNVLSEDLGGFREQLDPHCFDACLASNPDVRGLFNHDANHILGRTKAGTMRVKVDNVGLDYEIDPPDTNLARDLMVSLQRGDVTSSSFGFFCIDDAWREDPNTGGFIRTVLKAELTDCSPVTYPAYPAATSGVRQLRTLFQDGGERVQAKVAELTAAREARSKEANVLVETPELESRATAKTLEVDGVSLVAEDFAYVGDPNKTDTWKLPIHFPGDDVKTKSHIRNALARFNQTEGIPSGERQKVWDRIVAAAKANGIQVTEEKKSASAPGAETRDAGDPDMGSDDGDEDLWDDDDTEDYRCAYRCQACSSMGHYPTAVAEDDPLARSHRKKSSGAENMDNEQKRCAYRCAGCMAHSYPTAVAEDDPLARTAALEAETRAKAEADARAAADAEDDDLWMSYVRGKKLQYKF